MAPDPVPSVAPADPGWHRFTTAEAAEGDRGTVVVYGSDVPTESELRLLGDVEGKRVLDLGCGSGHNAVVLARAGAKVIGVDDDAEVLGHARERAEDAEVRVELHQSALADLAFVRSDSVDAAISVMAMARAEDLARVFRQVHRVLKRDAPLVCSFPHPAFTMFDPTAGDPLRAVRPYQRAEPHTWELGDQRVVDHPRTIEEIFTTLHRASFAVDHLLEPTAPASGPRSRTYAELMRLVPPTLVVRARKQGD